VRYLALIVIALALTSCAANSTYMGISLRPGAAEPDLQALARRAAAGDKQAQLELGIRYEEGNGVPLNLGVARILYMGAAATTGGTFYFYSPPVGGMKSGNMIPVNTGVHSTGLEAARARLQKLNMPK
jgi:hypothetical protein